VQGKKITASRDRAGGKTARKMNKAYMIATHIDKGYCHNHTTFCAVGNVDSHYGSG
jgi:hypothetical protein